MTQPQRVIYLPPGMSPAPPAAPPPNSMGVPFDRAFFEQILPRAIQAFCAQTSCPLPVVELMTADGTTHYVNAISGVADLWVALQTTSEQHQHPVQTFVPYSSIFRVEIHPEPDNGRGHVGFVLASAQQPTTAVGAATPKNKKK